MRKVTFWVNPCDWNQMIESILTARGYSETKMVSTPDLHQMDSSTCDFSDQNIVCNGWLFAQNVHMLKCDWYSLDLLWFFGTFLVGFGWFSARVQIKHDVVISRAHVMYASHLTNWRSETNE